MVIEYLANLLSDLAIWLLSLMGTWTPPDWLNSIGSTLGTATTALSGLGAWVNWPVVNGVAIATAASWVFFAKLHMLRSAAGAISIGPK